jgi:phage FluMu gp28-like protein
MQGGNPDVVLESTPNGAQGYFYQLCMEAMSGQGVWTLHFYPWWWDDAYQIKSDGKYLIYTDEEHELCKKHNLTQEQIRWRRNKILELKDKFKQEYPEDAITCFLTSGNSYFGDMTGVFTAPMKVEYNPEHEYYAGLDFGQSSDYTAMPVLDATTKTQVDLLHINKLSWSEQRARIKQFYDKWHIRTVGCEMNSIGSVNFEELHDMGLNVIPFNTTNETKADIMSGLYEAIHSHGWKLQDHPVLRHEMQTFVSKQLPSGIWRLAADGEGHDDTVMGLAIAKWTILASKMQIF